MNSVRNLVVGLLNRTVAPYVDNLNPDDLNINLWQGDVTLKNLRLKKSAVEKYNLPVEMVEGTIGHLRIKIPWAKLKSSQVEVSISDVYLLCKMKEEDNIKDPAAALAEDEKMAQEAKQDKLRNAEAIDMATSGGGAAGATDEENQGVVTAAISQLINNLQVSIQNIHIRYEDHLSTPEHPFAAGFTLAEVGAFSTDGNWEKAFLADSKQAVRKLATLEGLSVYFDTDAQSIYKGEEVDQRLEMLEKFNAMISTKEVQAHHQYILAPVSGKAKAILNKHYSSESAKTEAEVLFDEIAFAVDDDQYRDALSMLDLFHFYTRTHQYRRFRPADSEFAENPGKARWKFAARAILGEVHDKDKRWSWDYFAQRRDNRKTYVELYSKTLPGNKPLVGEDQLILKKLELELSYEDIRFFRSVARAKAKEDAQVRKRLEEERTKAHPQQAKGSWLGWVWGGSAAASGTETEGELTITEADRKELKEIIDYDATAMAVSDLPNDYLVMKVSATLTKGSLSLRSDPHGRNTDVISLVFDTFSADVSQLPNSLDATISLGDFRVFDGTMPNTLYSQIVRVKEVEKQASIEMVMEQEEVEADEQDGQMTPRPPASRRSKDPFFSLRFEHNPLDGRADNAMSVKMRHLEIIYHRGYVESVVKFFKPPASQLESIGALLDAAGETLEGIRKETRAGLEFALEQHKTIDMQVDMNAPIIIIPEDPTTKNCLHLVLDAGHIAVSSKLADKEGLRKVQGKRGQQYSDEDFRELEDLMYDRFTVDLDSTQLLIGNDLESCLKALDDDQHQELELHIVERINMSFSVQNAILNAPNLTKFKVSGDLPHLQVNFSDTKYKSLMRFIDVAIPKFNDDEETATTSRPPLVPGRSVAFRSRPNVQEYTLADDEHASEAGQTDDDDDKDTEEFFEATDHATDSQRVNLRQKTFEFSFSVGQLRASLSRSTPQGVDRPLADATLERFGLDFALRQYDMSVDVYLSSLNLAMIESGRPNVPILSSAEEESDKGRAEPRDLVHVKYVKVQKNSPEFMTVHDGVDQTVEAEFSTFNFNVSSQPVLSLYDFIMTTFVPGDKSPVGSPAAITADGKILQDTVVESEREANGDKIRIRVKLTSIRLMLQNGTTRIATLSLSAADVALLLRNGTLRLSASLGNLSLVDDAPGESNNSRSKDLLTIEGKDLADFSYETFDASDLETFPGFNSSFHLRAGSLRFTFMEGPLHELYVFALEFARMKAIYDAASQAAMQRAAEVTRMHYDIVVKTPILILPRDGRNPSERLTVRLGEISARNKYGATPEDDCDIHASLTGINVSSETPDSQQDSLQMIDNVNITFAAVQRGESNVSSSKAAMQVDGSTNDIKLALTQYQYNLLMDLVKVIPRVLSIPDSTDLLETPMPSTGVSSAPSRMSLNESLTTGGEENLNMPIASSKTSKQSLAFKFEVPSVNLELYGEKATSKKLLVDHSIARFRLVKSSVTYKTSADGSAEAEVSLKSFTMSNTRSGSSIFREVVPAAEHDGNQFMLQYTVSGGAEPSAQALVTIDSPQVIFAVDPMFALLDFAMQPFRQDTPPSNQSAPPQSGAKGLVEPAPPKSKPTPLSYRVEIVQSTVVVLASDSDSKTQAIQLSVKNLVLAQQSKLTLVVHELGMSLGRMDQPAERVSFLDNVDVTLALDSVTEGLQQHTSIELDMQPIIFRASYTDIMLIVDIVNKAIALASPKSPEVSPDGTDESDAKAMRRRTSARAPAAGQTLTSRSGTNGATSGRRGSLGKPTVIVSRESLKASFEGFQLVLIGDLHELPIVHLSTKPFVFSAGDWTGDLKVLTNLNTSIHYYNLANSHWEPLMDPWDFTVKANRTSTGPELSTMAIRLQSKKRLELNLTSAFIELAITTATVWSREGERIKKEGRGDAPFVVRNRTGYAILLWSDSERKAGVKAGPVKRLNDGESIPWRFKDHKKMRENLAFSNHNAFGIQIENTPWEKLQNISVDREGDSYYALRPRLQKIGHRLVCDVKLEDSVKVVTFRSSFKIENKTHLPMEMVLVDENNKPTARVYKIPPGQDCPLPIEAAVLQKFKLRPDRGFDYAWCGESIGWRDMIRRPVRAIACRHRTPTEAPFRFQAAALFDKKDSMLKTYPRMTLRLRAPIEVENLLPYNIRYRVYDKNTRSNTTSFLIKGGSSPIHTVDLDHLLLLSVEAQDSGFKQSDFAIINTDNPDDFRTEDTLLMADKQDAKLSLKLHYLPYPDSGGAFKVQIFSPYIVMNKTGLPFSISTKTWSGSQKGVAGQDMFENDYKRPEPTPFLFAFPNEERSDRLFLRIADSDWSKPFSVEGPKNDAEVILPKAKGDVEYHVGLSYTTGLGKYQLSKVITLAPRFLVRNDTNRALLVRQYRTQNYQTVPAGNRVAINPLRRTASPQLIFALDDGPNAKWSSHINLTSIGRVHVTLPDSRAPSGVQLLRVEVIIEGSSIFLYVSEEPKWPFLLRNETDLSFAFEQCEDDSSEGIAQDRVLVNLGPKSSANYTWDTPAAKNPLLRLVAEGQERKIDLMAIGIQPPFKFETKLLRQGRAPARRSITVSLDVRAEGMSQILTISPYEEDLSVYKPRRPGGPIARTDSMDSLNAMSFETKTTNDKPTLTLSVDFEGIAISVINRRLQELVYMSFRGLKMTYTDYPQYYETGLDCKWIQIDNQLFGGIFPIILYPTAIPKDGKDLDSHPTLQLSVAVLKDEDHGVFYVKYASILLQAMTIEIDEDFAFAIMEFTKFEGASWEEAPEDVLIENAVDIPEPQNIHGGLQLYFEDLILQPMQLEISFVRTDRVNVTEERASSRNPMSFAANAIMSSVLNINAAPIRLNAFVAYNIRESVVGMQKKLLLHYQSQVTRQLFQVLGSADFLGNPVGLFNNVTSGFTDIFYEPYQGIVMHGNKELGIGIARGATSFAKKTIFGVTDSMTKVTSSIGKGLSAATMDTEFQSRRRMTQRRNKPKHALYGAIAGANAFATSVASGFEGVVLKPLEGAEAGGVGGFFKGVGKGFVGAVTKPAVGFFDFASTVTEGIRNTTTVFDQNDIDKIRLPRFISSDGILRPFNEREALGQSWLKDLENGQYFSEVYVAHLDLTGDDSVVMLTTSRILLIRSIKLRVIWDVAFDDLQTISLEQSGISLVLKGDVNGPFLPLAEQSQRMFLFKHVEMVVRKHNEAKKAAEA